MRESLAIDVPMQASPHSNDTQTLLVVLGIGASAHACSRSLCFVASPGFLGGLRVSSKGGCVAAPRCGGLGLLLAPLPPARLSFRLADIEGALVGHTDLLGQWRELSRSRQRVPLLHVEGEASGNARFQHACFQEALFAFALVAGGALGFWDTWDTVQARRGGSGATRVQEADLSGSDGTPAFLEDLWRLPCDDGLRSPSGHACGWMSWVLSSASWAAGSAWGCCVPKELPRVWFNRGVLCEII